MIKRLCTILLAAAALTPAAWAQTEGCPAPEGSKCPKGKECASFAPKKGQWEFALMLGRSNSFYNENTGSYLLTDITPGQGAIGLPNGSTNASGSLNEYLNIDGFNDNSLVNIVGLQTKYFFKDCWDVNFTFGMNIGVTPKKDYVNSISSTSLIDPSKEFDPTAIPAEKYVNAQADNNWFVTVGVDRYFATKNPRINPYVGVLAGFQMCRITTSEPYTGRTVDVSNLTYVDGTDNDITEVPEYVFMAGGKAGQMMGITGSVVAGVEYGLSHGLYLALECRPLSYRYDIIQIAPQGFGSYNLCHHNIKIVDMPILKLGVRF